MSELAQLPETGTGRLRLDLVRRLAAEALGTGLSVMAVVSSGIMASRLSPNDISIQLLENAAATAAALIGLILIFGAASGAHFDPVITLVDRAFGTTSTHEAALYIPAPPSRCCSSSMAVSAPGAPTSSRSRWGSGSVVPTGSLPRRERREHGGHHLSDTLEHLRWHQTLVGAHVHCHATHRRGHRLRADPALPPVDRQR